MVAPTQAQINEAVMIAKNATYKLAYELALEQKYGGVIDCCVTKLKLLWMYERALACHLASANANGTAEITSAPGGSRVELFVASVSVTGIYTMATTNVVTEMISLTSKINTYQTTYRAVFDSTLGASGKIAVTGADTTDKAMTSTVTGGAVVNVTSLVGVVADNCLTDDKAKKLIAKIKSICVKQ